MGISQAELTDRYRDWEPPTDVERSLAEAKSRGDWDGYLRVLSSAETFTYVFKERSDRGSAPLRVREGPDGSWCVHLYTRGELLREPRAQIVVSRLRLPEKLWKLTDGQYAGLRINPGTPTEAYFPGKRKLARRWRRLMREAKPVPEEDQLVTRWTGVREGPLAHGLACGAHLSVHNAVLWNDVGDVYHDYRDEVEMLRDMWSVTDHASWRTQMDALLEGRNSPPQPEYVLAVRNAMAEQLPGRPLTADWWRETAVHNLWRGGESGPEERLEERHGEEYEEALAAVTALTGQILRYEARFRADGLLPPEGRVTSALGYDYGRAVSLARWGRSARYVTTPEAEEAVVRAGELCRETYDSWEEFSAGYILGRSLRFDQEEFGTWYDTGLTAHRILAGHPESPWHSIPFDAPLRQG